MSDELWTTSDGKVLKITEMDDVHLQNAVRYLRRNAVREAISILKNEHMNLDTKSIKELSEQLYPMIKSLEKEQLRRKKVKNKIETLGLGHRKIDI